MRESAAELTPAQFREAGHRLVDQIAEFLATIAEKPVAPSTSPHELRALIGGGGVPEQGASPREILDHAASLMFANSTFNGHPRFFGYITSSAAPIGALADLLAAAVNSNCGAWGLSPMATEIERQAIRWDRRVDRLLAGSRWHPGQRWQRREHGVSHHRHSRASGVECSGSWRRRSQAYESLCIVGGPHLATERGRHLRPRARTPFAPIAVDANEAMSIQALRRAIADDRANGLHPAIVVGTAGSVSTGAIDPLSEIAALCRAESLWFHVDGAYGAPAAMLKDAPAELRAIALADSVAVDPHKWLYSPLEAGCALVRDCKQMHDAFVFHPPYYAFDGAAEDPPTNFYEWGPQNSRGFRALKVWTTIRQVGRQGYVKMIGDDIELAREMHRLASASEELEAFTQSLSITTFRYVPRDLRADPTAADYLNSLNKALLARLQEEGIVYVSNAVIGDVLRAACLHRELPHQHVRHSGRHRCGDRRWTRPRPRDARAGYGSAGCGGAERRSTVTSAGRNTLNNTYGAALRT
jgi:glutamate/tyrosine decarboxylase-like PLP-dependent enzyme